MKIGLQSLAWRPQTAVSRFLYVNPFERFIQLLNQAVLRMTMLVDG